VRSKRRQFVRTYLLSLAAALLLVGGMNFFVDPFDAFGMSPGWNDRKYTHSTRRTKGDRILEGRWRAVLAGSSCAEVGLDPEHPALPAGGTYNLGLPGTGLFEVAAAVHTAVTHNKLQTLVLLMDMEYLTLERTRGDDFARSVFDPAMSPVEYQGENLFGMEAIENSVKTLLADVKKQPPASTPLGLRVRNTMAGHGSFVRDLRDPAAGRVVYRSERVAVFESAIADCLEHGVAVKVMLGPIHAETLSQWRGDGTWEVMERYERDVTAAVARQNAAHPGAPAARLFTFANFSRFNREPIPDESVPMRWYIERRHFKRELGDVMLWRVLHNELPGGESFDGFGVRLNPATIDGYFARRRLECDRYMKEERSR
jgi:hypothetical protein